MHQLVPELILQNYALSRDRDEFTAAAMFVDLTGFSNMSDDLARHGHHGSEMLAAVMQAVFEPLVSSVYTHGGFVVGFAGDAITAVFLENDPRQPAALRCLSSAKEIRAHFASHATHATSFGSYAIAVKIGLAYGATLWEIFHAADRKQAAFCFRGAALDRSAAAEHHAQPGQVWIDRPFYEQVHDHVSGAWTADYFRVEGCTCPAFDVPLPVSADQTTRHMSAFFPEALIHLEARGEFRPVINLFIDIPAEVQEGAQLQTFMRTVFALQAQYGGYFPRPDFGDKGSNLLIFWGAPVAYENDIDRALNFILDLRRETGLNLAAGISYRLTYAGFIGSTLREDYTGYGWGISLAARMMKSAEPGEIWVDEQIARRIENDYVLDAPQERAFKGFVEKQKVYRLLGRKEFVDLVFAGSFDGRASELEQLAQFVAPLWQGLFAGALLVKGEAGVGKSRLVYEFKAAEIFSGERAHWAICQSDEIVRQGFNPLRYWLRQRFGISNAANEEENRKRFAVELNNVISTASNIELRNELERTRSVLAALLNIFESGSLYEQLDANARYENTFIALSVFIRLESLQHPLVMLIEDAHVIDEDTRAFITYLMRVITADETRHYPIAIIATARLEGPGLVGVANHPLRELTLGGLSGEALQKLASHLLGRSASPGLVNFLEQRAEGNPFFVEQVLKYLQESQLLQEQAQSIDIKAADRVELFSTDIQSILITRLDRLAQDVKEVVQSASVLGREFELRLLLSMLADSALPAKIASAEKSDIWIPLTEIRYIFRHALMRDAAYTMQLHSRQRQLHALAVTAIEQVYAVDLVSHYGELAYHAERGFLNEKARAYLKLAGDAARDAFANIQAEDYYTRALRLTPENEFEECYTLLLEREAILSTLGKREAEWADIEQLQALANKMQDASRLALAQVRQSKALLTSGSYEQSINILNQVLETTRACRDDALSLAAIDILAQSLLRLGKYPEAAAYCHEGLDLARKQHDRELQGVLLNTLGMVMVEDKNVSSAARYFEQSLAIFREINMLSKLAMPLSNLGMVAGQMGQLDAAWNYYEQGLQLARQIGQRRGESLVLGNLGWVAGMLGDYGRARTYLERSLQLAREIGNLYVEINALINLSSTAGALGDYLAGVQYAERAVKLARESNDRNGLAWACTYLGHNLFSEGKLEESAAAYRSALEIRAALSQTVLASEPGAGLGRVLIALDRSREAAEHIEPILQHIANGGTLDGTDEPIRVYHNCYLVLASTSDSRAPELLRTAHAQLKARAASIPDAAARQKYMEQVSYNREILQAWQALNN